MASDLKTNSAISKAMQNPLIEATKKSDVADVISDENKKKLAKNQISQQLDNFENLLIQKKKFKE